MQRLKPVAGVRQLNRTRVLDALRVHGELTHTGLVEATHLSPGTVSSIVRELRAADIVDAVPGSDRRKVTLRLSRNAGIAVGVDFGHEHVRVAITDLGHRILAEADERADVDHDATTGTILAVRLVRALLDEVGADADEVVGVGVGLPAPIDRETRTVGSSSIMPDWVGRQPEALLSAELGLPVIVDNDANLGALAEHMWGAGRGVRDLVYVKLSSGVGAGLLLDGSVYHGAGGLAGEIGHTVIDEGGPLCRCGGRGCLETFVGGDALLALAAARAGEGLTLPRLVDRALAGDRGSMRVIADAGRLLGRAVANLCNLVDVRTVVIGGPLARAGDVLFDEMRVEMRRALVPALSGDTTIVASELGDRAQVRGAVALVLSETQFAVASGSGGGPSKGGSHERDDTLHDAAGGARGVAAARHGVR